MIRKNMIIKAIARINYKDNEVYYRNCFIVDFLKDWTNF